ncbi:MAG: hypothetical protein R3B89_08580 [Polyangiaceae bacterium]
MGRQQKCNPRRLSKLALTGWFLGLGSLTGCRAEPPPGAKAEPGSVHLEVDSQGDTRRLSAAEAARPLPRTPAKEAKSDAEHLKQSPSAAEPAREDEAVTPSEPPRGASPRVAERRPSPPDPEERAVVVPAGFSLGQDPAEQAQPGVPPLLDAQGQLLPQTEDLPGTDSAFFKQIGPTLFKAIVDNNPELMLPYFMPVPVYEKLKDSKNPPRDWKYRLFAQLKRDIERYHRLLGKQRERARFVALDVVPEDALWMKPGREYNKLPYYRLFGSSLRYVDFRGRERRFEVSALFSWRGEWYVVHLNGLK